MKLRNLALALCTAVLLPTFACASEDTDTLRASFDRDLIRGVSLMDLPSTRVESNRLIALSRGDEPEQILASFARILSFDLDDRQTHSKAHAKAGKPG